MLKMKYLLISLFSLVIVTAITAQTNFEFSYDNNGNRISRVEITLKTVDQSGTNSEEGTVYYMNETLIKVFPNPSKGYIQIESSEELESETVIVYDLGGRTVLQKHISGVNADIDLSAEPAGKYLLIIGSKNDRKEFIIIKE